MGILRTDKISGLETPTPVTGSVLFDGTGDYLTIASTGDFAFGTGDFTIEMFVYHTNLTGQQTYFGDTYGGGSGADGIYTYKTGDNEISLYDTAQRSLSAKNIIQLNTWHHIAWTRSSGTLRAFLDGVKVDEDTYTGDFTTTQYYVGDTAGTSSGEMFGYISNLRVLKGTALYTSDFTVPTHELEVIGDTVLLCCNNPDSAGADGTGKTITVNGDAAASTVSPALTRDFTSGTEFGGVTTFDTQGYFVPPSGTTTDRDSAGGRGVIKGGDNAISYISISSQGNSKDFGDLTVQAENTSACASSTRGLFSAGYNHPLYHKIIDYVTIATTGNATSFGSITTGESYVYGMGGCSSSTRGLFGGGFSAPSPDALSGVAAITYVTIASLGNSQSFGDLTVGVRYPSATSSPIRGIFGGGRNTPDGNINVISYVTIATTGDATNFGDLTFAPYSQASTGSSTRGMTMGGFNPAGNTAFDNIDYVTIASTGNAQDFGNLTVARGGHAATSNAVRGTFAGGNNVPAATNHIDYVTIASTGDALDFGDLTSSSGSLSALSDSHGGLS